MRSLDLYNLPNLSNLTMALGSTQPLTEGTTRNLPVGEERQARKADNLTVTYEPTVYKMWEPRRLTTVWASTACYRDSFTSFFLPLYTDILFLIIFINRKVICYFHFHIMKSPG
jgi:hypothetical protein